MIDIKQDPDLFVANELDMLEVLIVLAKRKKLIVIFPLVVAFIVGLASLMLSNVYKASTNILPPQQAQSGAASVLAQLGGVASIAGVTSLKSPNELFVSMLRSRTIADGLIKKFELSKIYSITSLEKTRTELAARSSFVSSKDGLIVISVEDEDPARAAALANEYVSELFKLTNVLAVTEAGQRRLFFERQFENSKKNLADAEINLKRTLSSGGVISVDTEGKAIIETVGRLRAQITSKEIQLDSMRSFLTSEHQDYKRVQQELISLRSELAKLENGNDRTSNVSPVSDNGDNKKIDGLENIKALRELKYQQLLYEMLAKQYEVARLDEAKEAPVVQVLDKAVSPERKVKPRRLIMVLFSYFFSLLSIVIFVIVAEAKRKSMLVPERALKWQQLSSLIYKRRV